MNTAKIPTNRMLKRLASGAGFALLAFLSLGVWAKHDFCQGWARHYAARATDLRAKAANPTLGQEERKEYLIAADWHDIISKKYAMVAARPWHRYPGFPLITPEEQLVAAAKHP